MEKERSIAFSVKDRNKIITIPEGITILNEGEVNLDMYKIISGNVEMYTGYGTKNEVLIGILGPGACFGEFGILLHKPAIYTIVTYCEVQLMRVTEGALGNFVKENEDCIIQIMRNMANMMMVMMHNVDQLSQEFDEMQKKVKNLADKADDESSLHEKIQAEKKKALRQYTGSYRFKFMEKYDV